MLTCNISYFLLNNQAILRRNHSYAEKMQIKCYKLLK